MYCHQVEHRHRNNLNQDKSSFTNGIQKTVVLPRSIGGLISQTSTKAWEGWWDAFLTFSWLISRTYSNGPGFLVSRAPAGAFHPLTVDAFCTLLCEAGILAEMRGPSRVCSAYTSRRTRVRRIVGARIGERGYFDHPKEETSRSERTARHQPR